MSICRFKHIVSIAITITIKKIEIDDSEIDEARGISLIAIHCTKWLQSKRVFTIRLHLVTGIINE